MSADMLLTADPVVASSIPARSNTLAEVDHVIISTASILPSAVISKLLSITRKKYLHEVLANPLVNLAQEKAISTDHPEVAIAVHLDVKNQTKPNKQTNRRKSHCVFKGLSPPPHSVHNA